jgi:hypothetical protein
MGRGPRTAPAAGSGILRAPDLYWKELQQLKAACICMRLYRNRLGRRVRVVEVVKAVASSSAIAAWVVWKDYPFLWTAIIAAAQVLDAIKGVFPFARHHKAASDLTVALEVLYIDAEDDWESIHAGRLAAEAITRRRTKLRKLQLAEEKRFFPEGVELPPALIRLATEEVGAYFELTFSGESSQ